MEIHINAVLWCYETVFENYNLQVLKGRILNTIVYDPLECFHAVEVFFTNSTIFLSV